MEKNNININVLNQNLLNDADFKASIRFEIEYASAVKGGHLPYYFLQEKRARLVSNVNLLSSEEQKELVYNLFTGKN